MNKDVSDYKTSSDSQSVEWKYLGSLVKIQSNGRLISVKTDRDKIVVVDISKAAGADNAFIYNPDGSLFCRVKNPLIKDDYICFDDVYFVKDIVTIICAGRNGKRACELNDNGEITNIYETR